MINQNIFIINYNALYEILEEIKENLPFKVRGYKNIKDFISDNHTNINDDLIISKSKGNLSLDKNFNKQNYLDLKDLPLSIYKLIEIINVQLIKLKFSHQSKVLIKSYELDLNSKFISKNDIILKLTEKEIEIILYLNKYKTKNTVLNLQKNIWGYSAEMETHTVETHIYRLRKKIADNFKDENFILSHINGYFID
jgi:hypothetical protein